MCGQTSIAHLTPCVLVSYEITWKCYIFSVKGSSFDSHLILSASCISRMLIILMRCVWSIHLIDTSHSIFLRIPLNWLSWICISVSSPFHVLSRLHPLLALIIHPEPHLTQCETVWCVCDKVYHRVHSSNWISVQLNEAHHQVIK